MPVQENKIGTPGSPGVWLEFFDLIGTVFPIQNEVELIDRPGTDGIGARLTGAKGKPFELRSITYHASFTAAQTAMASYVALKSSIQTLVRNSVTVGTVIVVEVTEASPPQAVYNVAGASGAQCRAEVKWKLVRV
jgi:hypothetical protein